MPEHIGQASWIVASCVAQGHPIQADGLCICGEVVEPSKDEIGWFDEDERGE